jgi:vitamin B12 transporter
MLSLATTVLAMSEEDRRSFMKMSEQERKFLLMYFDEDELFVVSTTRSLKSIDRIAENVDVVTAEDIELMNAHTVAEVLNKVVGLQVRIDVGPGSYSYTSIQGSEPRHVAVFMDGILTNDFVNNYADTARIPVQIIDRIEIIKGPASSVWGSSLGGVVNIITKSGSMQARSGGTLSLSAGERTFLDLRAELYGKKNKTGYYIYAGRMQADGFNGLVPHNGDEISNLYLKLSQDLTKDSELVLTTFFNRGEREWAFPDAGYFAKPSTENFYASLTLNTTISDSLKLSVTGRTLSRDFDQPQYYEDGYIYKFRSRETSSGAGGRLTWNIQDHTVVIGADYDSGLMKNKETDIDNVRQRIEKWAVYANDTIALGKLTVTPGIRFDNDNIVGEFVSPSLGVTYDLFEKTLLRAFVARGFSSAPVTWGTDTIPYGFKGNPDLKPEEVISYQLGIETGLLKYFWLKISGFRHDIRNAIVQDLIENDPVYSYTFDNKARIRRQGIEAEIRSMPFYNFTIAGGTTLISTEDRDTGETILDTPTTTIDINLKYDDQKTLKALLTGHYIWWNSTRPGSYNSVIVDANLIKQIYREEGRFTELFLTGHNLFEGQQRQSRFTTPGRWFEAGLRFKF